jgi:hypothetical protein
MACAGQYQCNPLLEELIPAYRARPGWHSGEGKAVLDRWEQDTRERLAKGA